MSFSLLLLIFSDLCVFDALLNTNHYFITKCVYFNCVVTWILEKDG